MVKSSVVIIFKLYLGQLLYYCLFLFTSAPPTIRLPKTKLLVVKIISNLNKIISNIIQKTLLIILPIINPAFPIRYKAPKTLHILRIKSCKNMQNLLLTVAPCHAALKKLRRRAKYRERIITFAGEGKKVVSFFEIWGECFYIISETLKSWNHTTINLITLILHAT